MKNFVRILMLLAISMVALDAGAQRKKETNKVTPKTAVDKEAKDRAVKEEAYRGGRDHHKDIQDKATRKRMKKNLKKAEKHSWGRDVPWYKRWFRRKTF